MNLCDCGHEPADHHMNFGACEATFEWTTLGPSPCNCPKYQWQGDN